MTWHIDDFGPYRWTPIPSWLCFRSSEERYEKVNDHRITASYLKNEDYIGDPTLADAISWTVSWPTLINWVKGESKETAKEKIIYICKESTELNAVPFAASWFALIAALQWYLISATHENWFSAIVTSDHIFKLSEIRPHTMHNYPYQIILFYILPQPH